jgi:hypothetical protein
MEQDNYHLKNLSSDDVISIDGKLHKVENLKDGLKAFFEEEAKFDHRGVRQPNGPDYVSEKLNKHGIKTTNLTITSCFTEGLDSEVLKSSTGGWKKGKLKFKVVIEFSFDDEEPEKNQLQEYQSPLDEIRREIAGYNQ